MPLNTEPGLGKVYETGHFKGIRKTGENGAKKPSYRRLKRRFFRRK